jgi:two-component system cell cycle response regulator DivK
VAAAMMVSACLGTLPRDHTPKAAITTPPAQQRVGFMPKKVLIVEDNELNMKLFRDLLEAHGYQTIESRDGVEALKVARDERPDLILMDIQLPEVSGLEVAKWIKEDESLKSIPIIAVTAFAMKGDEEKIREGGCEGYLAKPISLTSFLETVERHLQ